MGRCRAITSIFGTARGSRVRAPQEREEAYTHEAVQYARRCQRSVAIRRHLRCLVASVLVLASRADLAHAEDPRIEDPAAQAHVDAGKAAYNAGDYEAASREFDAAYAIVPEPVLLYGWAQSRRLGGHCAEAVALYRRFLASDLSDAQIAAGKAGIALCEQASSTLPPERSRQDTPPRKDPTNQPPPAERREPSRWYTDPVGGGLVIGGAISVGVGITFFVLSRNSEDAASTAEFRDEFADHLDQATTRRRIGLAGAGIGGALLIGGILRYATYGPSTPAVVVGATGSSLVISGRF